MTASLLRQFLIFLSCIRKNLEALKFNQFVKKVATMLLAQNYFVEIDNSKTDLPSAVNTVICHVKLTLLRMCLILKMGLRRVCLFASLISLHNITIFWKMREIGNQWIGFTNFFKRLRVHPFCTTHVDPTPQFHKFIKIVSYFTKFHKYVHIGGYVSD